jgi:hypothetical protein
MEEQLVDRIITATHYLRMMGATALGMLALFLLVATASELRQYQYIGAGIAPTNTISVTGEGEVFAVPDTAVFSFSVAETGKDVASAQAEATKKSNDVINYLKRAGIAEADIKTTDYNVNPRYEYTTQVCPNNGYCPPGKQTIIGYEVTQTVAVKVHDTSKAGTLLSGVGARGVSSVSGLDFTIADEDMLKAQARDKAIAQAKTKAIALAKSLGVSLVRVVNFDENQSGGGVPIMYAKAASLSAESGAAPVPQIPVGQNKITSNVQVTFEIR